MKTLAEPEFESEEIVSERLVELDKDNIDTYSANRSAGKANPEPQSVMAEEKVAINSKIKQAIEKGYTGDLCPECQSMTMVRNGTCLKCITCGSTSGCS